MKKIMIVGVMIVASLNGCFAMKYHTEIQESDFNNLMIRDEESLVNRHADQCNNYPRFKALVEAIYNKDTQTALELIAVMTQEELNVDDYGRRTPLIIAIEQGQEVIALALVEAMDNEGLLTPQYEGILLLDLAGCYKMFAVVEAINFKLENGILDYREELLKAISFRETQNAVALIRSMSREELERPNELGTTILMHVAGSGAELEIIQELLKKVSKQHINIQGSEGRTALMYALDAWYSCEAAPFLIVHLTSDDLGVKDCDGNTALIYACQRGNRESVKLLLEKMKVEDIKSPGKYGSTALMFAVQQKYVEHVKALLPYLTAEDLKIQNEAGMTSLMYAVARAWTDGSSYMSHFIEHNVEIAKLLLEKMDQRDIGLQDGTRQTALMKLAQQDHTYFPDKYYNEMAELLIKSMHIDDLNFQDVYGMTALEYAIRNKYIEMIEILSDKIDKKALLAIYKEMQKTDESIRIMRLIKNKLEQL